MKPPVQLELGLSYGRVGQSDARGRTGDGGVRLWEWSTRSALRPKRTLTAQRERDWRVAYRPSFPARTPLDELRSVPMTATLLLIGLLSLLVGVPLLRAGLPDMRRRGRILRTPMSSIARAQGDAPVEISGRILPSKQGLSVVPFTGRKAVMARVIVQRSVQGLRGQVDHWVTILDETYGRPFLVDDGSGQMARVAPPNAKDDGRCAADFVLVRLQGRATSSEDLPGLARREDDRRDRHDRADEGRGTGARTGRSRVRRRPFTPRVGSAAARRLPCENRRPARALRGSGPGEQFVLANMSGDRLRRKLLSRFMAGAVLGWIGFFATTAGLMGAISGPSRSDRGVDVHHLASSHGDGPDIH